MLNLTLWTPLLMFFLLVPSYQLPYALQPTAYHQVRPKLSTPVASATDVIGLDVDGSNDIIFCSRLNHSVYRSIAANGTIQLVAGSSSSSGTANGYGPAARFQGPRQLR